MRSAPLVLAILVASAAGCRETVDAGVDDSITVLSEKAGVGRAVRKGDVVTIDYRIITDEGREILSEKGYRFELGTASVIAGVEDAVKGMRVSGERVVSCPPQRHWGRHGYGDEKVPAHATLRIEVALKAID